jgi:hypothetical protein
MPEQLEQRVFTCARCGRTIVSSQTDADADREALERWGVPNASTNPDMAVVCDICWQTVSAWGSA